MTTSCRYFLLLICFTALTSCDGKEDHTGGFTPSNISIKEVNHSELMELQDESLIFVDARGVKWVAPKKTLTDGATVPRIALTITDGRFAREFLKAAVVHDAYCQEENKTRTPEQYRTRPWRTVHRMFYEGMLAGGTSRVKAGIMYLGVLIGGPRWGDPGRELQEVSREMLRIAYNSGKMWVEASEPKPEHIESWIDKREPALRKISQLESRGLSALRESNFRAADASLMQAEAYLERALNILPNDSMLLNLKGNLYKNRAIQYRKLEMNDKANEELNKASSVLHQVINIDPRDPSALVGLGSVLTLRGDLVRAEEYVGRALVIDPGHPAAKHDLGRIKSLRESHPQ